MAGAIEAAGDIATGAAWSRSVEPRAGEADDAHGGGTCLNCGTTLAGRYCHGCGQSAHVHRTLHAVGHDLLHGVFHFEGKIWRTLPMLALRPGELTRRYIAGERARFVSPLALFLFCVLLMFAAVEALGPPLRPHATVQRDGHVLTPEQLRAAITKQRGVVARLTTERQQAQASHRPVAPVERRLAAAREELDSLVTAQRVAAGMQNPTAMGGTVKTGWQSVDRRVATARANPELAIVQIQSNAHKFAWALIPISLPFLWLLFAWRRDVRLYDHVVFVTYSLSAVMLLLVVMAAIAAMGLSADWLLLIVPVHFLLQLRGAYRLGWWGAVWRTPLLVGAAFTSMLIFGALVLYLGTN